MQQNWKSPSSALTAHNSTRNRTFMCNIVVSLAPYAVFSTWIHLQHIARPVESECPTNTMFVRSSVHSSVLS